MTLPDSVILQAAHAAREAETENIVERCDCDWCMAQRVAGLNAALPVLREAIERQLIERIVLSIDSGSDMMDQDEYGRWRWWLSTFLSEEHQP